MRCSPSVGGGAYRARVNCGPDLSLVPYLCLVSFAMAFNFAICRRNPLAARAKRVLVASRSPSAGTRSAWWLNDLSRRAVDAEDRRSSGARNALPAKDRRPAKR